MNEQTGAVAATDPQGSSAPSSPPSGPGSGASLEATGFKWGASAPPDWQGKDADYAVQQYNILTNAIRNYVTQQAQPQAPAMPQPVKIDPDEVVTNPAAWQEKFQSNMGQQLAWQQAQALAPLVQSTAEAAKHLSRTDPALKQVWDKWGSEVDSLASGLAPAARTDKRVWDGLAKIVKANHVDEIAQDRAKQLATEMGHTITEGGFNGAGAGSHGGQPAGFDKLAQTPHGKELLDKYGTAKVNRMCEARGISVDKFAEECAKTQIIRNPNNPSEWTNRNLTNG